MPRVHNQLDHSALGQALKDALGDTKSEGMLERFGETMQPTIDLWALGEWAYLRREFLWAIRVQKAADAANTGLCGLSLPLGIRALVVVDGVSAANSTANGSASLQLLDRVTVAALAGFALGNAPQVRDQRWWGPLLTGAPVPFLESWTAVSGAAGLNNREEQINSPTVAFSPFLSCPYILRPGGAIYVQGEAVNQIITANFWGRLRVPMPGELRA